MLGQLKMLQYKKISSYSLLLVVLLILLSTILHAGETLCQKVLGKKKLLGQVHLSVP